MTAVDQGEAQTIDLLDCAVHYRRHGPGRRCSTFMGPVGFGMDPVDGAARGALRCDRSRPPGVRCVRHAGVVRHIHDIAYYYLDFIKRSGSPTCTCSAFARRLDRGGDCRAQYVGAAFRSR